MWEETKNFWTVQRFEGYNRIVGNNGDLWITAWNYGKYMVLWNSIGNLGKVELWGRARNHRRQKIVGNNRKMGYKWEFWNTGRKPMELCERCRTPEDMGNFPTEQVTGRV